MYSFEGNVVTIKGDLTMDQKPELQNIVREIARQHGSVIFELAEAGFVNSAGLMVFASPVSKIGASNVILRNVPPSLRRTLAVSGLERAVTITNVLEKATTVTVDTTVVTKEVIVTHEIVKGDSHASDPNP